MDAPSTYATFAKVLSSYHDQYAAVDSSAEPGPSSQLDAPIRHDAVVDEQGGLLAALMGSLEQTLRRDDESVTPDEREALLLEHRTWGLVRSILENRLERSAPGFAAPSAADQLRENPYTTPEDLTQTIVNEDDELSLFATMIDHLQTRPLFTAAPPIEARHGYLPSTVRRVRASKLNAAASAAVPPSLDPDFPLRDPHTYTLAGEDATYQGPLLDVLWDLVRHGELDRAIAVCEEGGEPWRAASLMGGRRWSMPGLTKDELALGTMEGNRTRQLWKKSCRAIAKNATLSPSERHLYAALTSDLATLLPACDTWEDHVWAHVQARLEGRIERRWRDLGGFWETESRQDGGDVGDVEFDRGALDDVFAAVADSQKDAVVRASHNPYYVAQKMIVLGRSDALLDVFADRLRGLNDEVSPELIGPLLRFFAHLVLVLRALALPVPAAAANAIIEAYLGVLERAGEAGLVAMYAACLREGSGEESYARFLRSMDPSASKDDRREALLRAKQHRLDVATIAQETVRMILQEAFEAIPALAPTVPDISTFATGLSERDVYLIRSIEWLTFVPETAAEALVKANDVSRYFLALGQAGAALALLRTLPDFAPPADDDGAFEFEEHEHVVKLFSVFAAHDAVDDVLSRAPKATATKVEQFNWKKKLASALDVVHRETIDVLTTDWLRFPISSKSDNGAQRKRELRRIRQIFVPDLVLRLHARLMDSRVHFPSLLQQALDLSKLVAAEDNHVYEEFLARPDGGAGGAGIDRLAAYLGRAREASMAALQAGSGDPFRAPAVVA